MDRDGAPWIFPNTNGMMGALGGMPERDGVDAGGHFWIPEGVANNCEDVEAQFPLLILYRKLLDGGADGAGRHRGGLGFVEGTISWNAGLAQVALALGDSFAKGAGPFGSNPGTVAPFIAKQGTDVLERLRSGRRARQRGRAVRRAAPGRGEGRPLRGRSEDDVWEFLFPTAGGFGDPLAARSGGSARRPRGGPARAGGGRARLRGRARRRRGRPPRRPSARRRAARAERLGREPGDEVAAPEGAQLVGDLLHVVDGRWWCNGADLGPVSANYKDEAVVREVRMRDIAPEYAVPEYAWEMADRMVFREFLCPVTGYRIDTELARSEEPTLHDIVLRAI